MPEASVDGCTDCAASKPVRGTSRLVPVDVARTELRTEAMAPLVVRVGDVEAMASRLGTPDGYPRTSTLTFLPPCARAHR